MDLIKFKIIGVEKVVRRCWMLADHLRDRDDGWKPYHWSANWKELMKASLPDGKTVILYLIFLNENRDPESEVMTAKLMLRSEPPNQGGVDYAENSVPNFKAYAQEVAIPMVDSILRDSDLDIEEVWRLR